MFEVGKRYEIETKDPIYPDTANYHHCEVVAWDSPLLKLREDDGKEWVLNTASSLFIKAEEEQPISEEKSGELLKEFRNIKVPSR
jgi:hypothetical protein